MTGTLFIVATPIGNLQDFSPRAVATLQQVTRIACEDTRHSQLLLGHFGIQKPLLALHQHNEAKASAQVLAALNRGEDVAYISDAGTPIVSDPGQGLTEKVLAAGLRVVPIPGPSAVMTALSASGLSGDCFTFAGFIPPKAQARAEFLKTHGQNPHTTIFFEAPHRIEASLNAFAEQFAPERVLVIARELTKQFEQLARLKVSEALPWLAADANHRRGEFVLLLAGTPQGADAQWQEAAQDLLAYGLGVKTTAQFVEKYFGARKKMVYHYLLQQGEQHE